MDFHEIRVELAFEERPYAELSDDLTIRELSDGAWYVEDLFGEEPESYMRAMGDSLVGDICMNRPDDYGLWVIDGDLDVDGAFCLSVWDMINAVVITGDLTAEGVVLDSDVHLYVLGSTDLSGPLITNLSSTGFAVFSGPVDAIGWYNVGPGETVFENDAPELGEMLDDEFDEYDALVERLDSVGPF